MTAAAFSYVLLAGLATALVVAALTDLRRRRIANQLNVLVAIPAPAWWLSMGFGIPDMGVQLALCAATFLLACLLFAAGQMGGGDVKLLTALALWFTPASFAQLLMLMAVLGGGASLGMAAFNMERRVGEGWRDGFAMLMALGWVWCAAAIVFAIAMQRPIVDPATLGAIVDRLPGLWAVVAAPLIVAALFLFGFRHIMRRQKSRIEVPYGIAIAAAALWVLGSQALPAARLAAQAG